MAKLLENGNMLVPGSFESPEGIIGEIAEEVTPDDPRYELNIPWLRPAQAARARALLRAAQRRAASKS